MKAEPATKAKPYYDWRQIRRWNEITALLDTAGEHKAALERETERTCELLFAYGHKLGACETTKASDIKIMRWAKKVPIASAYPRAIATIARLNDLLAMAVGDMTPQTLKGDDNDEVQ